MLGKPCGKARAEPMNPGIAMLGISAHKGLQRRLLRAMGDCQNTELPPVCTFYHEKIAVNLTAVPVLHCMCGGNFQVVWLP